MHYTSHTAVANKTTQTTVSNKTTHTTFGSLLSSLINLITMAGNSSDEYDGPPAPMTIWGRVLAEGRRVIETPRDELSGQIVEDLILMEKLNRTTHN